MNKIKMIGVAFNYVLNAASKESCQFRLGEPWRVMQNVTSLATVFNPSRFHSLVWTAPN